MIASRRRQSAEKRQRVYMRSSASHVLIYGGKRSCRRPPSAARRRPPRAYPCLPPLICVRVAACWQKETALSAMSEAQRMTAKVLPVSNRLYAVIDDAVLVSRDIE